MKFDFTTNGIAPFCNEKWVLNPLKELWQQPGSVLRLRLGDVNRRHTSATDRVNTDGSPLPQETPITPADSSLPSTIQYKTVHATEVIGQRCNFIVSILLSVLMAFIFRLFSRSNVFATLLFFYVLVLDYTLRTESCNPGQESMIKYQILIAGKFPMIVDYLMY